MTRVEMVSEGRTGRRMWVLSFLTNLLSPESTRPGQIPLWDVETFVFEQKTLNFYLDVKLVHECLLKCGIDMRQRKTKLS